MNRVKVSKDFTLKRWTESFMAAYVAERLEPYLREVGVDVDSI